MWRNLESIYLVLINIIRCPLVSVLYIFTIKFGIPQRISLNVKFRTAKGGRIVVKSNCIMESNVLCKASRGCIIIGKHSYINRNCNIVSQEKIEIGENSTIGPNVCIYDHDHNYNRLEEKTSFTSKGIVIGKNVWIGANAIILKGVTIKDNSVISAGAIVTSDVEENMIYISKHINTQYTIKNKR